MTAYKQKYDKQTITAFMNESNLII